MQIPEIEIDELTDSSVKFTLSKCEVSFANAIRRVLLSEIPTLAIEIVEFEENITVFPEEMLTDRLGLVPIDSRTADSFKYPEECTCAGACASCAVIIELNVSNTEASSHRIVTSSDLIVEKDGPIIGDLENPCIITKLGKNQKIRCKCIARKGTAKNHAKWAAVSAVSFGYDGENKFRHTRLWYSKDPNREWPAEWFMGGRGVSQTDEVDVGGEPSVFHFNVEVVRGCMEPLEALLLALKILREKVERFSSAIGIQ